MTTKSYSRKCKQCGQQIELKQVSDGRWVAFTAGEDARHECGTPPLPASANHNVQGPIEVQGTVEEDKSTSPFQGSSSTSPPTETESRSPDGDSNAKKAALVLVAFIGICLILKGMAMDAPVVQRESSSNPTPTPHAGTVAHPIQAATEASSPIGVSKPAARNSTRIPPDEYLKSGLASLDEGEYERAVEELSQAIDLGSKDPLCYTMRGQALLALNRNEEALSDADRAVELGFKNEASYAVRGQALLAVGELEKSVADFDKVIKLDPKDPTWYALRGTAYFGLDMPKQAASDFSTLVHLEPANADHYARRSVAWNRLERYDDAVKDCTKAIGLDPKNSTAYNARGYALDKLGHPKEAVEDLDQAIELGMRDVWTYTLRGDALKELRDATGDSRFSGRALEDYNTALSLTTDPDIIATIKTRIGELETDHGANR